MSRSVRFVLPGTVVFVATTGLAATWLVLPLVVALFIGFNAGLIAGALAALRSRRGQRPARWTPEAGLWIGAITGIITASALLAPFFIAGLTGKARLGVQLLILSTGYAGTLLAWWGCEQSRKPEAPTRTGSYSRTP